MTITASAVPTLNGMKILEKRYLDGGTVDDLWDRVSGGNVRFRKLLSDGLFLPNSPTLFNAGKNNGCTLSACFCFTVEDSMRGKGSIVETREKAIAVAKAGGGVGYYFSKLRPKGSLIKSIHRKACGPVTVLRDYHAISNLITQGGKRELAQMGVLDCDHADVREFIHCKDKDPQGLGSFNISVGWRNDWLEKVNWESLKNWQGGNGRAFQLNNETSLWWEQCESAWGHGCPGMWFPDTVNSRNYNKHLGLIYNPNPCFVGETKVWTIYGPIAIKNLVNVSIPVLSQDDDGNMIFKVMRKIRKTGKGERVYQVTLRAKQGRKREVRYGSFTATANHMIYLKGGGQRKVLDLRPGDRLSSVYRNKANSKGYLCLKNTSGDVDMEHRIVVAFEHGCRPGYPAFHVDHIDENKVNNLPSNLRVLPSKEHNALKMLGEKNPIHKMLVNPFSQPGFNAKHQTGKKHSAERVRNMKAGQRRAQLEGRNHEVVCVEYVGREDVYCGSVDDTHRFFIQTEEGGGVLVQNCAEAHNRNDEACSLGSLPLPRFFLSGNRTVDWQRLGDAAYECTEFMDDILDRNEFPHPDITTAVALTRRLGLGVMGWADLLAMCHIHYDTQEALDLADKVMKTINDASHAASEDMAIKKGPYPGYGSLTQAPMRRNETNTSIAPTGTIAIIAGMKGHSIEPWYAHLNDRTTSEGMTLHEDVPEWIAEQLDGFVPKTAHEIGWQWHVRHQAAFQRHTDLGVSKTINMPKSATVQDVSNAYKMLHDLDCNGGTVFRDGCRNEQVLVASKTKSVYSLAASASAAPPLDSLSTSPSSVPQGGQAQVSVLGVREVVEVLPVKSGKMPRRRVGEIMKFKVGSTEVYLGVGLRADRTVGEIFVNGNFGTTMAGLLNAFCITFSVALQNGVPLEELIKHHQNTRFEPSGLTDDPDIHVCTSIPDFIVRWLRHNYLGKQAPEQTDSGVFCPDCGAACLYQAGCLTCSNSECGWSRCG